MRVSQIQLILLSGVLFLVTAGSSCEPAITVSRSEEETAAVQDATDTSATDAAASSSSSSSSGSGSSTSTSTAAGSSTTTGTYSKGSVSGSRSGSKQTFYMPGGMTKAVLLSGDRVLLIGNGDRSYSGNRCWTTNGCSEIYDYATNSWASTGEMPFGAYFFTAVVLTNGNVLIAGGQGSVIANQSSNAFATFGSAALYDVNAGTWSSAGTLTTARQGAEMVPLADGTALICGGSGADYSRVATCEKWNGSTTWNASTPAGMGVSVTRANHQFIQVTSTTFMMTGDGLSSNTYDSNTTIWASVSHAGSARSNSRLALIAGGGNHVISVGQGASAVGNVEIFDGAAWATKADMATAMVFPAAISNSAGTKVYSFGGETDLNAGQVCATGGGSKVTQAYNVAGNSWSLLSNMQYTRCNSSVVRFSDGKIGVVGGRSELQANQTEEKIEIFNPATELFE